MEIGLSEYIISDHAQPDPDPLMSRKVCNSLLLLCGIANSGLVWGGIANPTYQSAQSFNSKPFLANLSFELFLSKIQ